MRALFVLFALLPGVAFAQGFSGGGCNSTNATCKGASLTLNTGALTSSVANSGTNAAFIFDTTNAMSGTTLLASFRSSGSEKAFIHDDGTFASATGYTLGASASSSLGLGFSGSSLIVRAGTHIYLQPTQVGAGTGVVIFSPVSTLPTCAAAMEGGLLTVARTGAVRTKLCLCSTADGSAYAWQNMATAAVGTTTTCG